MSVIMESHTGAESMQCCLWFHKSQSPTSVQRKFRTKYHKKSPQIIIVTAWYNQFIETGCVSNKEPGQGRPCVADEMIENAPRTLFAVHENQLSAPVWS
jgi:hypothetical protein